MWLQIIVNDVSQLLPVTDVERKGKERKGNEGEGKERKGMENNSKPESKRKRKNVEMDEAK